MRTDQSILGNSSATLDAQHFTKLRTFNHLVRGAQQLRREGELTAREDEETLRLHQMDLLTEKRRVGKRRVNGRC